MLVQCPVCGSLHYKMLWKDGYYVYYFCEKCGNTLNIPLQQAIL